jgi:GNAT superfamily N-acetyltransferase
MTLEKVYRFS